MKWILFWLAVIVLLLGGTGYMIYEYSIYISSGQHASDESLTWFTLLMSTSTVILLCCSPYQKNPPQ